MDSKLITSVKLKTTLAKNSLSSVMHYIDLSLFFLLEELCPKSLKEISVVFGNGNWLIDKEFPCCACIAYFSIHISAYCVC